MESLHKIKMELKSLQEFTNNMSARLDLVNSIDDLTEQDIVELIGMATIKLSFVNIIKHELHEIYLYM